MKIVHISDIHTGKSHFLPELAEKVIKRINEVKPEIVVVTGDLTNEGSYSEFVRAKSYIERIECEAKVVVPGNHDARNVGDLCFEEIFGARSKILQHKGVTVVGVDSTQPDLDEGHVGREKYEWIERCLTTDWTDSFKVVALHHHLISVPKTGRERNILTDAGDVLELLLRCGTDLVLCGHKHVPWVWNLNGTAVVNAGTACSSKVKWNIPPSFNLIEICEADEGDKGRREAGREAGKEAGREAGREEGGMKIFRMYSKGGQELVWEKK